MPASCMGFVAQMKMLNPYLSGQCLFYTTVFDKSNSAPGHLKNVWCHSSLLINISQRQSLKHLQKVILSGGEKAVSMKKKKNVSKLRKIPLLSNTTKHIVDVFIFQKTCWNNFLTSWRKLSCFVFISIKQYIFQKRFSWLCCRFANQETKTIVEMCCLNVGVCSTAQAISTKLNQFIEKRGFDRMKYKAVATNGAATMQGTSNGVVRKIKNISLDRVSTSFLGEVALKWPKKRVNLVIMPFSVIQKCPKIKNGWKILSYFGKMTEMSQRK